MCAGREDSISFYTQQRYLNIHDSLGKLKIIFDCDKIHVTKFTVFTIFKGTSQGH